MIANRNSYANNLTLKQISYAIQELKAASAMVSPGDPLCECQICGWIGTADQTLPIHRFWERVQPGEVMPVGECPKENCGALVHYLD